MEDVINRVAAFVDEISRELLIEPWAEAAVAFLATDDGMSLTAIVGVALGLGVFAGVLTSGPAKSRAETATTPKPADMKPLVDPKPRSWKPSPWSWRTRVSPPKPTMIYRGNSLGGLPTLRTRC
jgi:hypothetical protein